MLDDQKYLRRKMRVGQNYKENGGTTEANKQASNLTEKPYV